MMDAFNKAGIQVMVDIVPNHSSDDHVWFQEALKSPIGSAARDRYIFRDGTSLFPRLLFHTGLITGLGEMKDQAPSDWISIFGGSAWEPVGDGQFYLHLFDTSQPDFNWDNQEVRDDFIKTLKFWADRGVKGFRIDVAHGCVKDMSEPLPSNAEMKKSLEAKLTNGSIANSDRIWDRDEVHEIYKTWREVFNQYDPPLTYVSFLSISSNFE
jgi:alpha-glucosidase